MAARKTKGRQKVEMKRTDNQDDRSISFSKRRSGIYKKASELVVLTGAEIKVIVFSPSVKPLSFGHPSVESVINRFLEDPSSMDTYHLVEAHRRMRIEELARKYDEMLRQLDEKKESTSLRLKGKRKENDSEGWWDAPIEELDLKDLIGLEKKFERL
ncbi:hypothetical protein POTOM_034152 [Populus tomentosa]|uniref:MADS-box domain-containing protein n=1 Tax=Populus tomentosa TaxID=118781 RepID=A0A8X7Z0R7_POPTO|nr:hypothetical protein POTOM_034152 [Populus tomentosa]